MPMITLSVLDQSPISSGSTASAAIAETVELAQATERFGYGRYWLAEHHSSGGLASTAPEILISRIASLTDTIRVGAGGVMLSHYSSLKVAETFRMLETLFPGRIDLGIGRAPGSDRRTAGALQHGPGALGMEYFPNQIADLVAFVEDRLEPDHSFAGVRAMPVGPSTPELWLLGSSDQSAALAAHFGCSFSFAHFINDRGGPEVMQSYFSSFRPSENREEPQGSIGVFVLCADTEDEAKRLCASRDLWRLRLDQGGMGPFPSVDEALAYPYSEQELAQVALNQRRQSVGTPDQVKAELLRLGDLYDVQEFVVLTICHDFAARLRSYELLAEVFELTPAS